MNDKKFNKYKSKGAYHWTWYKRNSHNYRAYTDLTLQLLPNPGSIIDIGCGDGLLSFFLFKKNFIVNGIDLDDDAIRLGLRKIIYQYILDNPLRILKVLFSNKGVQGFLRKQGLSLKCQSVYDLPENQKYDYSVCLEVIEHLADPSILVEKISAITRLYAIISTPNGNYCIPDEEDYRFWKPKEFIDFLGKGRSKIVYVDENRIFARVDFNYES